MVIIRPNIMLFVDDIRDASFEFESQIGRTFVDVKLIAALFF